jgi:hypothetical protein
MISGPLRLFEQRCRERGYTLDEVRACIVAEDGDSITVDEAHSSYPRERRPTAVPHGPSLLTKAINFTKSAAAHVAAGMPRASDAEIERRFSICQGCEHYDGKACTQCGCPVVRESRFVSKLAWAGEKCPVGKWEPVEPA